MCHVSAHLFLFLIDCTSGSVRLFGTTSDSMGTVEYCINGAWTTICDSGWTSEDAAVVCTQLGQPSAGEMVKKSSIHTFVINQP